MRKLFRKLPLFLLKYTTGPVLIFLILWNGYILEVPSFDEIKNYHLAQTSEIYSSDSVLLGKLYLENRKCISYNEMPDSLIKCLLATEDNRFYEHNGIDFIGLARVVYKSLLLDEKSGGGSTITQQLVKNRYPRKEFYYSFLVLHKIREWLTAMKMEYLYSKEEILEHYLNTVPFGHNSFGIYRGAAYYFNKTPVELKIHEMATLIGILKGTSFYDPVRNPDRCIERRNLVLTTMNKQGFLSDNQLKKAMNSKLILVEEKNELPPIAPFFLQHIKTKVKDILRSKNTYARVKINPLTAGLKIYTTIDSRVQQHAENALRSHLSNLQKSFDSEWTHWRWNNNMATLIRLLKHKRYEGYQEIVSALENNERLTIKQDSMLSEMKADLTRLQAGFTCIKNTGEVLAWVGGRDFRYSQYDHVKSTRQVGSSFKPIVYATAVDQGVNICNYFKNSRQSYHEFDEWSPRNASNNYAGEYTMKGALTYSLNVISVKVLFRAGLLDVLNVARQMGITQNIPELPSISLGTPDISLYEMVNAYTVFANDGKRVHDKYLLSVQLPSGEYVYKDYREETKEVFGSNVASIMTNMMESVVNVGTSRDIRRKYHLKGSIAGKTGTTQKHSDGWFIGYTPKFTAGAWVGADNPDIHFKSLREGSGSKTAMPIWAKFAQYLKNDPYFSNLMEGDFTLPSEEAMFCLNQPLYRESPVERKPIEEEAQ